MTVLLKRADIVFEAPVLKPQRSTIGYRFIALGYRFITFGYRFVAFMPESAVLLLKRMDVFGVAIGVATRLTASATSLTAAIANISLDH